MSDAPRRAEQLAQRFVAAVVDHQPVEATGLGDHGRDHELPDLSQAAVDVWIRELSTLRSDVGATLEGLTGGATAEELEARGDLELLADELDQRSFWLETRPRLRLDPLAGLDIATGAIHELLRRTDLPVEQQRGLVDAASARARGLSALLEQAGSLLEATPVPHAEVAVQRAAGAVGLVREELPRRAKETGADVDDAAAAGALAAEGFEAYAALVTELADASTVPWRLGPELHAPLLRAALGSDMDIDEIASRARAHLDAVKDEMDGLASDLWRELRAGDPLPDDAGERIRGALDGVARSRAVDRADLVAEATRAVDECYAWTAEAGFVDLPPLELLTITKVPAYLQGIAVAFIQPAPALEPEAGSTYYLSPIPDHWDEGRAVSFLREYNAAVLRSLALHEGVPGHFVQLEHAARHPRLARRLFWSSAFAEGWAVHIERIAVHHGFGDTAYRLSQRKLELRLATNALLDVGLHAGDLDDEGAMELMLRGALQEDAEARGKLVRAKVTAGQLCSYFVGGEEFGDLHAEARAADRGLDLRLFHRRLLSHGTPTMTIARRALAVSDPVARRPFAGP